MHTDRHLLLGLLALQCGFITKDQLVSAFSDWTSNKSRSLEQILTENKAITPQQQLLLAALVDEHLKQHDNNPEKSLAALSSLPPITHDLRQLADPDLNASLASIPLKERDDSLATTAILDNSHARSSRFVILRKHAKGGLGQVSVALDSELNRHVALKEMLAKCADDPASQQRFVQEAEITGQLEHPGIVPVYGLGTYGDGRPYYAMRFVEGDNLRRAVDQFHKERKPNEQLSGARAVEFRNLLGRFVDVCNAIEYAHSRKVLHRDLKPDNILLGPYGETLVVDWGLAKALGRHEEPSEDVVVRPVKPRSGSFGETIEGSAIGTPAYMSPEQAEGKLQSLGPATDVYSLGATLYAVLTGAPPVQGDTAVDTLEKVRRGEIERPRKLWISVPKPLEAVCLKAMSLSPSDRYSSAKALADEIEKWLADEPVSAFQELISVRARRWMRKHPAIITSTAVAMILGLCAASIIAYMQGAHVTALKGMNETISGQVIELTKQNNTIELQKGDLQESNKLLDLAKKKAEEREKDAVAAVKRFGDAVARNPELRNNPKLDLLRKDLLTEPLQFFRSLRVSSNEISSERPERIHEIAMAAISLGDLNSAIGKMDDAINAYKEAQLLYTKVISDHPREPLYKDGLATCYNKQGLLLRDISKMSEALKEHENAKSIYEELVATYPTVASYRGDLAKAIGNIGRIQQITKKFAGALRAIEAAKSIQQQLVVEQPEKPEFKCDLAKSVGNIGAILAELGRFDEAIVAITEAQEIQKRLATQLPSVVEYRLDYVISCSILGSIFQAQGKNELALLVLKEGRKAQSQLAMENPSNTRFKNNLSQFDQGIASLSLATSPTRAIQELSEARRVQEDLVRQDPEVVMSRIALMRTTLNLAAALRMLGNQAEALDALKRAEEIGEKLATDAPEFQAELAQARKGLGVVLQELGKLDESAEAHRKSMEILLQLTQRHPGVPEYSRSLAEAQGNTGSLLNAQGKFSEAIDAFNKAIAMYRDLVSTYPASLQYKAELAWVVSSLAELFALRKEYRESLILLRQAIAHQKTAMSASPNDLDLIRESRSSYKRLMIIAKGLDDPALEEEATVGLAALSKDGLSSDDIDNRLLAVSRGETAKDSSELIQLAEHAYKLKKFAVASRLFSKALVEDAKLTESRQSQVPYNAACSAALAAFGQDVTNPVLDDDAKFTLRSQALTWLKSELTQWQIFLGDDPKPEAKQTVAQTMAHWQQDSDLASIRDADKLAVLPEAERKEWEALWAEVMALHDKVSAEVATPPMETKESSPMPEQKPTPETPMPTPRAEPTDPPKNETPPLPKL